MNVPLSSQRVLSHERTWAMASCVEVKMADVLSSVFSSSRVAQLFSGHMSENMTLNEELRLLGSYAVWLYKNRLFGGT
jgi:hypothetical protein